MSRPTLMITLLVGFLLVGVSEAQARLTKVGVAGSSTIRVECGDALSARVPQNVEDLKRRFKSDIIIRCVAVAAEGSGVINAGDFSWRYKYGSDTTVTVLRNSNAYGSFGQVYGPIEREFYFGLPQTQRPEVILLMLDGNTATITFVSNP